MTSRRATAFKSPSCLLAQSMIQPTSWCATLAFNYGKILTINDHVSAVVRSCNYNIRQLRAVHSALSQDALRDAAYAVVLSRLDYCNSLYANAPVTQMRRLQMIINIAAHVVSGRRLFDPITDFIKRKLHWLPAIEHIQFNICTMVFKTFHNQSPNYFSKLRPSLDDVIYILHLNKLVPRHRTHFSERVFAVAGPTMWNLLPVEVRNAPTLMTFSHRLNPLTAK